MRGRAAVGAARTLASPGSCFDEGVRRREGLSRCDDQPEHDDGLPVHQHGDVQRRSAADQVGTAERRRCPELPHRDRRDRAEQRREPRGRRSTAPEALGPPASAIRTPRSSTARRATRLACCSARRWASSRSPPALRGRRLSRPGHVAAARPPLVHRRLRLPARAERRDPNVRAARDRSALRVRRADRPRHRTHDRLLREHRPAGRVAGRRRDGSLHRRRSAPPVMRLGATSSRSRGSSSGRCSR